MAEKILKGRIVQKHDIESNWQKATSFIPKQGEIIVYDIDDTYFYERFKIGDGSTLVNDLPFCTVTTDTTLTQEGVPADAKAVGDALSTNIMIAIKPATEEITAILTHENGETVYNSISDENGIILFNISVLGNYTLSFDNEFVSTKTTNINIDSYGKFYNITANYDPPATYTVVINTSDSNPATCCAYEDDAGKMLAGDDEWDETQIFENIRPCVFKDGEVQYYLKKQDFTMKESGEAAVLTGEDGDVMIEIPRFAYRIYQRVITGTDDDGNTTTTTYIVVSVTNDKDKIAITDSVIDEDGNTIPPYQQYAFTKTDGTIVDKIYLGAYIATYNDSTLKSALRSVVTNTTVIPTANGLKAIYGTWETMKALAEASGYNVWTYQQITALQCLFLLKYRSLDSQTSIGRGYVNKSSSTPKVTGLTAIGGMTQGVSTTNTQIKFLGIEDFWGHMWQWVDNLAVDVDLNIILTGPGAMTYASANKTELLDHPKTVHGSTELGFIITATGGTSTTYFCDKQWLYDGSSTVNWQWQHGGASNTGTLDSGIFCGYSRDPENSGAIRLMYM